MFAARLLGLFIIYPVFAQLAQGLPGASPQTIGLALGAYGLAQALLQIPLGMLSDRVARKTVIAAGLGVFALGSVVAALATSIDGVIVGRVLQGAGAVGSTILATVADLTREEVRTRAMAVVGVTIGLSFGLAVVLGPPLAAATGLSGLFWITAALGLVGVVIALGPTPTPVASPPRGPAWSSLIGVLPTASCCGSTSPSSSCTRCLPRASWSSPPSCRGASTSARAASGSSICR